uniref:Saccharopine dehydrogenase n=1 Tax=Cyanothece sp. (strain PCC 7425 / ATCC 29141) TaxID=395961 RepID=B8HS96_CYAP4
MPQRYVVIGGAGAMGRITVRDLVETTAPDDQIVVADYDWFKAEQLAVTFNSPRVEAVHVNVQDVNGTAELLRGASVVINSAPYKFNLAVMEAALIAQTHYIDLGGLFHMTRQQLGLHQRFLEIDRTALLGMGSAPGITNLLARFATDRLDQVNQIHIRTASIDKTKYNRPAALAVTYSLKTILEEFSLEPAVFTQGEFSHVPPLSGATPLKFPSPVGKQSPMYTLHSEVATLPFSFAAKGVQEVSFKIAFDSDFLAKVQFLRDLGFARSEPVKIQGVEVAPIEVANYLAMNQPVPEPVGKLRQYELLRAIVKGFQKNKKVTWIVDCHVPGLPAWGIGLDIDTGAPPAIAAQMISSGAISLRGTIAPEVAIAPEPFFTQLQRRGMFIKTKLKKGWKIPT